MRDIFSAEAMRREVIPLAIMLLVVLVVFLIAFYNPEDLSAATAAVGWTMGAIGSLIAVLAGFGLFWRALQGDPLELQFGFVLALLGGLLLVNIHWSLAIALGLIGLALIVREIWLRYAPAASTTSTAYSRPSDRPMA
jgi:uncharacterized membrane protein AbrB (regulator of aidB expression)